MGVFEPGPARERVELANEPEFELGGMRVRPAERLVVLGGEQRELQPRVMQVLVALAEARPQVVSRDRLLRLCWDGRIVGDDALNRCVLALRHLAQEFTPQPFVIETVSRVGHRLVETGEARDVPDGPSAGANRARRLRIAALVILMCVALAASMVILRPWERSVPVPAVLVTAAANDGASRHLAKEVATQLASIQAARPAAMRLLSQAQASSGRADLILHVSRVPDPARAAATAVLEAVPSRTVLWSSEFEHPSRKLANLRQQLAYTAAHVLDCASEGLRSEDPLAQDTLKTYLDACAAMSDAAAYDARPVTKALESVVNRSPRFVGGWAKLLQAETEALASPVVPAGPSAAPALRRHILAARRIKRDLPEAYVAEFYLLPPTDFAGRGRLIEEAVQQSPHHAGVRSLRALFFASTGATDDAVREAREAVRLDPLSPALRDVFVASLGAAGDTNAALREVATLERLWPGSSGAIEARYRTHLRYGDPREALRLIDSRAIDMPIAPLHRTFLEARIDPSPGNVERVIRQHRIAYRDYPQSIYNYAQVLAEFDRKAELLAVLLNPIDVDELALSTEVFFRPAFRELHRDPRFLRVAKRAGLIDYWRRSGWWPDFCYAADLPYDCKAEAAKIENS